VLSVGRRYRCWSVNHSVRDTTNSGETDKPLLLIHGLGGSWREWTPILDALTAEREVIALDLPGFGDSSWAAPLSTWRRLLAYARDGELGAE